jgi:DNA modification methylase
MISVGKVGMVTLSSIIVEDRVRKEMGDLIGLETNMKESGLISPLAVKDNKDGTYKLLAGERRYTVLKRNEVSSIPVRIYEDDLSELEMKVIEKSENFYRKDMEYWEFDKLTMEIHQLQQHLHGVKLPGPNQEGWGTRDTAEMIGAKSPASVVEAVKRAEAREVFPELFEGCKTASDASKVMKKVDQALVKQQIAQKLESESTDVRFKRLSQCFVVKSFFEGVKDVPDSSCDLVEIDPPYSIELMGKKKHKGESNYTISDYNEISIEHYIEGDPDGQWRGMRTVFTECYRVMKPNSWLICWFGPDPWFEILFQEMLKAGFDSTRMCGIWAKGYGQSLSPTTRLANSYEMFFYAHKGRPALNKAGRSNLFTYSPIHAQKKTHPTERPTDMMKDIYETFVGPNTRLLIPFLGSGNGLIAAHELGISASGFELSKAYKDSFLVKVSNIQNV